MLSTLLAGAATCLLSGSFRLFALITIALLIVLHPFKVLALVVAMLVVAVAAAFAFDIVRRR